MLPPNSLQRLSGAPVRVRELVVRTAAFHETLARLARYAASQSIIVLVGPTGSGKSLLAEAAHWLSGRAGPVVEVSGPELASELAEDTLFGHERGAFTSADGRRPGVLAEAGQGTVVLDDFDRTTPRAQASLLRVLQSGRFRSLGANRDHIVGCRFIVCLRQCPDELMAAGVLLPDLRYRLGYCIARVPALSERRDAIAPLAGSFLAECPSRTGVPGPRALSPSALAVLITADWPGNVRQLGGVIEAAYLNAGADEDFIDSEHLPETLHQPLRYEPRGDRSRNDRTIALALLRCGDRVADAARLLDVHRNTITEYRRRVRRTLHSNSGSGCANAQLQDREHSHGW